MLFARRLQLFCSIYTECEKGNNDLKLKILLDKTIRYETVNETLEQYNQECIYLNRS